MKPSLKMITGLFAAKRVHTDEADPYDEKGTRVPLEFTSDTRTKVLYVFGPSQMAIRAPVSALTDQVEKEHLIFAAGPKGPVMDDLNKRGLVTFLVDIIPGLHLFKDYWVIRRLRRILLDDGITMIHAHGYKAAFVSGLAARRVRTPIVLFSLYNFVYDEGAGRSKHLFYDISERILPSLSDRIIASSEALRRRIIDKGKAEGSKVLMIHTGIRLSSAVSVSRRFSSTSNLLALKTGAPVVVAVGPLAPHKGMKFLLSAAVHILREVPSAQFVIVGDGPSRLELELIAEKYGIHKKVTFTGWREDIRDIIAHADVLVSPSLTEGLPLYALEAMAENKPVVATAVGGTNEVVIDRENGFLVPTKKPMILAHAVLYLLMNHDAAVHLGVAGRRRVEEEFDLKKTVKATADVYKELMAAWRKKQEEEAAQAGADDGISTDKA